MGQDISLKVKEIAHDFKTMILLHTQSIVCATV